MKMTIDEHIKILKSYHNGFTVWVSNIQDSIDVAVDIMEKYQKIEQISKTWDDDENAMILADKIREVIEDGDDE